MISEHRVLACCWLTFSLIKYKNKKQIMLELHTIVNGKSDFFAE